MRSQKNLFPRLAASCCRSDGAAWFWGFGLRSHRAVSEARRLKWAGGVGDTAARRASDKALTFFGHNPFWVVWKADFAVYKNEICPSPLSLRSMREAAVRTAAESRATESELPSRCAGMNKPARVRVSSLLNDLLSICH
jgi:hypothetical protein